MNGGVVGEDADDVGTPLYFAIDALKRVRAVNLRPVFGQAICASTSCSAASIIVVSLGKLLRSPVGPERSNSKATP